MFAFTPLWRSHLPLFLLAIFAAGACRKSAEHEPLSAAPVAPQAPVAATEPISRGLEMPATIVRTPISPSRSSRAALRDVALVIRGWAFDAEQWQLQIAFETAEGGSYGFAGELRGRDFELLDASGQTIPLLAMSSNLALINPPGGLEPGSQKVGWLGFPKPPPRGIVELRLPSFEPLHFRLAQLPELDAVELPRLASREDQAPGPSQRATKSADGEERQAIKTLLSRQATALARYDLDGYLETFAPQLRAEEQRIFQQFRLLPVAALVMLPAAPLPDIDPQAATFELPVEMRLHLDGLAEDNPLVYTLFYSLEREQGDEPSWRVVELVNDGDLIPFWRQDALTLHRSHHFLIYSQPDQQSALAEIASQAEASYAALRQRGLPLDPAYVIHFVPDRDAFAQIAGTPYALGVALARYVLEGNRIAVDSRAFYINGAVFSGRFRNLTAEIRHQTITHELVHLALARQSRPFTPAWLKEGVAVYFSGGIDFDATRQLFRQGLDFLDLRRMTSSLGEHRLGTLTAEEYLYSANVVAYLIEQYGQERFLSFYGSFAQASPAALMTTAWKQSSATIAEGLPDGTELARDVAGELTSQALERHFDTTLDELQQAVAEWLWVRHR